MLMGQFLGKRSTLLLSADSALFRYLGGSQPGREEKLPQNEER